LPVERSASKNTRKWKWKWRK